MIFYFTGTGNSRWVASQLASAMGDEAFDISFCLRSGKIPPVAGKRVGVVFPIHSWRAPRPVMEFLSHLELPEGMYRFAVCTCGDDAGKAMQNLARVFGVDAAWSITMPNTYVPMFSLDTDEVASSKIRAARKLIPEIARLVQDEFSGYKVHEGCFPRLKSYVLHPLFVRFVIRTRGFHVDEGCVSCGTCVQVCPLGNVSLMNGRPKWGEACLHCMACLHGCPAEVIQYGTSTRQKGRYRLARYLS